MSILYIGPYRQNDYNGLESSVYLKSIQQNLLHKNISLYSRPYYARNDTQNDKDPKQLEYIEENIRLDCIIQHAFIEHLSIQPVYNNIAIPILRNNIAKTSEYNILQKLNYFDHIIVGDEHEKKFLLKSDIKKPIHVAYHDLSEATSNLDILNSSYDYGQISKNIYNFMFVGEYKNNIDIIHSILYSFIVAIRSSSESYSLTFILKGTGHNKKDIEEFYIKLLNQLKIVTSLNIRFYFTELNIKDLFAALNSADCLISLNHDNNQKLYTHYILKQNKQCLNYANIDYNSFPCNNPSDIYDLNDSIKSLDINSLISGISRSYENSKHNKKDKKNNTKSIGKIVCEIMS